MRVFITGGDGFIGRRLTRLLEAGFRKVEIYDISLGDDIRDIARLDRAIEMFQPDVIVHLAALAGVRRGEAYPAEYYSTNVLGTENVFAMAKKHGVKKVISFSSSSAIMEEYAERIEPASVYGRTKVMGELIAKMYSQWIPSVAVVRPFTVYGEKGRPDQVIGRWIRQINRKEPITFFGDGNSYRPYTYVGELCEAVEKMMTAKFDFEIFNICGANKVNLSEVLEVFENKTSPEVKRMPMPEADSMGKMPDNTENWDIIGYKPTVDFKEKLGEILDKELKV